jgi:hypothetical protein
MAEEQQYLYRDDILEWRQGGFMKTEGGQVARLMLPKSIRPPTQGQTRGWVGA